MADVHLDENEGRLPCHHPRQPPSMRSALALLSVSTKQPLQQLATRLLAFLSTSVRTQGKFCRSESKRDRSRPRGSTMHCACEGAVLLVGEGDFSLTLALLSCEGGLSPAQVVTTTMETEESLGKHQSAEENVHQLQEKGARVLYRVDGRDLHNCPALAGMHFVRIIFNFPHAGGKSDLKKNRALLNEFFQSAVQVLEPGGKVMVTLCRGQGGTPADVPRRAWHDSWQIQAMAANAGLVLRHVLPFHADHYPQYACTGFRSQDKGFHTEGALTHVFHTAEVVTSSFTMPPLTAPLQLPGGTCLCPAYLLPYLHRSLLEEDQSPVRQVCEELQRRLASNLDFHRLPPPPSPLTPLPLTTPPPPEKLVEVIMTPEETPDDNGSPTEEKRRWLRGSLLDCLPDCLTEARRTGDQTAVISGPVFTRCLVSPSRLPARHQLLVISCSPDTSSAVSAVCSSLTARPCRLEDRDGQATVKVPDLGTLSEVMVILASTSEAGEGDDVSLGSVWSTLPSESEKTKSTFAIVLDLDNLTQLVYDLPDPRLLWSSDPRCLEQFKAGVGSKFTPISMYPLTYEHDMSFWENPEREFDELAFHEVLETVAGDVLTRLQLLDTYHQEERRSRCYRLTFTCHDRALPYIASWKLQSSMRLLVARELGVTLR